MDLTVASEGSPAEICCFFPCTTIVLSINVQPLVVSHCALQSNYLASLTPASDRKTRLKAPKAALPKQIW